METSPTIISGSKPGGQRLEPDLNGFGAQGSAGAANLPRNKTGGFMGLKDAHAYMG